MRTGRRPLAAVLLAFGLFCDGVFAQEAGREYVYREIDGRALRAYVFSPADRSGTSRGAILLFHGGGWAAGSPEWTFDTAQRLAGLGMVAISIEYRLSLEGLTPVEALDDTCAAFRWARRNAPRLSIDPDRVAGHGVSAGGHLIAAAATVGCPEDESGEPVSARPDALVLWSPALDVTVDGWFRRLLQGRAPAEAYSPAQHVGPAPPPTTIVHGEEDTLTPLAGAKRFCDRVIERGVACELNVYEGVGHLLTRNLANQESDFDPDPEARAAGIARQERFLRQLGFIRD